jgi:hypothetical protein
MIRDLTEGGNSDGDLLITVRTSVHEYPLRLWVGVEDTVGDLKAYLGERLECYRDEMSILVNGSYPYPLTEEMRLDALLMEHRHLLLVLHEGGQGPGRDDQGSADRVWWSQKVPERYLQQTEKGKRVLDIRYLAKESVKCIRSWIYQERDVEEIWLLGTHPQVMEILYAVAEDVLSLVCLRRIRVESPDRADYRVPPRSSRRAEAFRQGGESRIQRQGLVYLYQHLLLDQYRSPEEVEIWMDSGLVPGMEGRILFVS